MEDVYPEKLQPQDRFLFYFSGHGETRKLVSGKRGYLVLQDAPQKGWSRMIDMPKVRQWSANVGGARQSLFILDACFSGLVGFEPKGREGDDETLERLRQPAHHLLTAGDEGERSYAADGESLFTDAFLRAAGGEGDLTGDGLVSLNELMVKVGKLIDQRRNELQDKIKMTPRAWLARTEDNSGEFFFISKVRRERAQDQVGVAAGDGTESKGSEPLTFDPRALDLAFWEAIKNSRKAADFEAYLRGFPDGVYVHPARSRLEDLKDGAVVALTTEAPEPTLSASAVPLPADIEAALGLERKDWRHIQDALTALGFDTRGSDGKPGANTRRAVAAWQESKRQEASGYLSDLQHNLMLAEALPQMAALTPMRPPPGASTPVEQAVGVYGGAARKPGDVFRDCAECPEMVVVPAGSFMMGASTSDPERRSGEEPQHRVSFARPFAVGRYEVTFEEWDTCVAEGGCGGYRPNDQGWGRGRRPVINVSWPDAKAYVDWLSRKTKQLYHLLSEAEWEYVARAGTTTRYWWGDTKRLSYANYSDHDESGPFKTTEVGTYPANPWGLYDMHGNVWEWVEDHAHENYQGAPVDGNTWLATRNEQGSAYRIMRGGSWFSAAVYHRAAFRARSYPDNRDDNIGFRCARVQE